MAVKTKMADISIVPTVRTGRNNLKTWQEQQEDDSKGDICYLENICGAEQPETCTIDDELNIDLIDVVSMFKLCF